MLSKIEVKYSSKTNNNVKFMIDDSENQKIIKLSIYKVRELWYIDILDNEKYLLVGKIINVWIDLFEILKIYYRDFPKLKLMPLPSNTLGIGKEFIGDIPGRIQEIFLSKDEMHG